MLAFTMAITIHLYLVVAPGQTATPAAEQQHATQIAQDALAWWTRTDPAHPTYTLAPLATITAPMPQPDGGWILPRAIASEDYAIYIYDNREPWYLLPSGRGMTTGRAFGHAAVVVLDARRLPWSERAALVHELGHALYGLPDRYLDDPTCQRGMDVMCNSEAAYPRDLLGCQTLTALGGACTALYWDAPAPLAEPLRITTTGGVQIGAVYVQDDVASINVQPPDHACWSVTATDANGQRATWQERRECNRRLYLPWMEQS